MWETIKTVLVVLSVFFVGFSFLFVFSTLKILGDNTRQEENRDIEIMMEQLRREREENSLEVQGMNEVH